MHHARNPALLSRAQEGEEIAFTMEPLVNCAMGEYIRQWWINTAKKLGIDPNNPHKLDGAHQKVLDGYGCAAPLPNPPSCHSFPAESPSSVALPRFPKSVRGLNRHHSGDPPTAVAPIPTCGAGL